MKKLFLFLTVISMIFSSMFISTSATEAVDEGISFQYEGYEMASAFDRIPATFEAWVYFPEDAPTMTGVILGDYAGSTSSVCTNFEITAEGSPRLYYIDSNGAVTDIVFSDVHVAKGEWTHVAIVRLKDENKLFCYCNGNLGQVINTATPDVLGTLNMVIGGDHRESNSKYFKGYIKEISVYSDVRGRYKIKEDMNGPDLDDPDLIAAFDLSSYPENDTIADISGNGYDATLDVFWLDEKEPVTDYAYSFAVIGDTQILAEIYPGKVSNIYDWIVDNVEEKKIKFVLGLGDITNSNSPAEWTLTTNNIFKLDGLVPYSVVRGNHDGVPEFIRAFDYNKYSDVIGGSYGGNMLNTWQELIVGDNKYLIMALDFGPSNEVLDWASEVIASHPTHNVIITTHAYLFRDGTTLDVDDVCPPIGNGGKNNGDHMWDKLISQHENIVMVISGHDPHDNIVVAQDKGIHGNVVTQMLVDPQGVDINMCPTGMVAMLYFSEDGSKVSVEYYSTVNEKYFMADNQFDMEISVVDGSAQGADGTTDGESGMNTALAVLCITEAVLVIALAVLLIVKKKK